MLCVVAALALMFIAACGKHEEHAAGEHGGEEVEAVARTEFTDRIENFFEYAPLKAGRASQFLIHLTDLQDGTPVERAEVTLTVRAAGGGPEVGRVQSRIGRVTGIYVADVNVPAAGAYDIEFHVRNAKLDERMTLSDFRVE